MGFILREMTAEEQALYDEDSKTFPCTNYNSTKKRTLLSLL